MPELQDTTAHQFPSVEEVIAQWNEIKDHICQTPTIHFKHKHIPCLKEFGRDISMKLELLQVSGSFKIRAALGSIHKCKGIAQGITTASGGNHAIAVAIASYICGLPAKVVVPATASKLRIKICESYGAEVIKVENISEVFSTSMKIAQDENFRFIHPFDGYDVALGTGGLAHEIYTSNPEIEALVVPIGGGGLISGISNYLKQVNPNIKIFGVEPEHSNVLSLSLEHGAPQTLSHPKSIADSLCAPLSCDYSFSIIQKNVDSISTISEAEILNAVQKMQTDFKLAVEPAAACGLAAILGPLKSKLKPFTNIGLIACGSNIDTKKYIQLLQ